MSATTTEAPARPGLGIGLADAPPPPVTMATLPVKSKVFMVSSPGLPLVDAVSTGDDPLGHRVHPGDSGQPM
jgi:hypothetical protein